MVYCLIISGMKTTPLSPRLSLIGAQKEPPQDLICLPRQSVRSLNSFYSARTAFVLQNLLAGWIPPAVRDFETEMTLSSYLYFYLYTTKTNITAKISD